MLFGWEDGQCAAEPSLDMEILAPPLPRCHAGLLNWSLCVEEEVQSFIDGPLLDPLVRSQYMIVVLCQSFWRLKEKYETRKYIYIYMRGINGDCHLYTQRTLVEPSQCCPHIIRNINQLTDPSFWCTSNGKRFFASSTLFIRVLSSDANTYHHQTKALAAARIS